MDFGIAFCGGFCGFLGLFPWKNKQENIPPKKSTIFKGSFWSKSTQGKLCLDVLPASFMARFLALRLRSWGGGGFPSVGVSTRASVLKGLPARVRRENARLPGFFPLICCQESRAARRVASNGWAFRFGLVRPDLSCLIVFGTFPISSDFPYFSLDFSDLSFSSFTAY